MTLDLFWLFIGFGCWLSFYYLIKFGLRQLISLTWPLTPTPAEYKERKFVRSATMMTLSPGWLATLLDTTVDTEWLLKSVSARRDDGRPEGWELTLVFERIQNPIHLMDRVNPEDEEELVKLTKQAMDEDPMAMGFTIYAEMPLAAKLSLWLMIRKAYKRTLIATYISPPKLPGEMPYDLPVDRPYSSPPPPPPKD